MLRIGEPLCPAVWSLDGAGSAFLGQGRGVLQTPATRHPRSISGAGRSLPVAHGFLCPPACYGSRIGHQLIDRRYPLGCGIQWVLVDSTTVHSRTFSSPPQQTFSLSSRCHAPAPPLPPQPACCPCRLASCGCFLCRGHTCGVHVLRVRPCPGHRQVLQSFSWPSTVPSCGFAAFPVSDAMWVCFLLFQSISIGFVTYSGFV